MQTIKEEKEGKLYGYLSMFWRKYKKFHRGRKGTTEALDLTECGRCKSRTGSLCLSVSHTEEKWERREDPTPLWNHFPEYTFFNPGPWPCHLRFMQQDTPTEDYSPLKSNLPFLRTIEVGSYYFTQISPSDENNR